MEMKKPLMVMALAATMASCHCHQPKEKASHAEPQCASCPMAHGGSWQPGPQWGHERGEFDDEEFGEPGEKHARGGKMDKMGGGMEMMGDEMGMMGGGMAMMMEGLLVPPQLVMHFGPEAGVSEDQMTKIRQDFFDTQTRVADLEPKLKKARIEMHRLLLAPQLDDAKILAQMDEATKAQAEIKKQRFAMMLRIRGLLTPEQRAKLEAMKPHPAGHMGKAEPKEPAGAPPGRPAPARK
jgi:uncharacterized membrane protein